MVYLVEKEAAFFRVQLRKGGSFMVTVPKATVRLLGIKGGETLKVLIDVDNRRIVYQL